jgi:large subunit ribosomal protein L7/L12
MTVMEIVELISAMEAKFGVSAAAAVIAAPAAGGGAEPAAPVEEKTEFNVVISNFGDKKLSIKKHLPGHRKSFRARHHCENPGPRTKARYWSCRAW